MRIQKKSLELLSLMALFATAAAIFLYLIGQYALIEQHPFQFFADSSTYHKVYAGDSPNFDGNLVAVNANYLGPIVILEILGGNIYLVMLLNVYLFCHSIIRITHLLKLDPLKVGVLLLLSPLTISSLMSVNKEVLIYPFIAVALTAYMRRSMAAAVLALFMTILVRWQLTGVYLVILLVSSRVSMVRRGTVLVVLLMSLSALYVAIQDWIEPVIAYVEASFESYEGEGSGLFEVTLNLQKQGLYFLVFPIKAFHLMFGLGFKLDKLLDPVEIYNDFFVSGHCLAAFIAFLVLLKRRLLTLRSDLMFAAVIFLAVFCLSPIFAPRYLYPVYVIGVLVLCGAPARLPRKTGPARRISARLQPMSI